MYKTFGLNSQNILLFCDELFWIEYGYVLRYIHHIVV